MSPRGSPAPGGQQWVSATHSPDVSWSLVKPIYPVWPPHQFPAPSSHPVPTEHTLAILAHPEFIQTEDVCPHQVWLKAGLLGFPFFLHFGALHRPTDTPSLSFLHDESSHLMPCWQGGGNLYSSQFSGTLLKHIGEMDSNSVDGS